MKYVSLPIIVFAFAFSSCKENENKDSKQGTDQFMTESHSNGLTTENFSLDQGKKWVVVPAMMHHIRALETALISFDTEKETNLERYHSLGLQLQQSVDSLTSNCTMEGQAHDELHKWLLPFIEGVNQLNKANEIADAKLITTELKASFEIVNTYFE